MNDDDDFFEREGFFEPFREIDDYLDELEDQDYEDYMADVLDDHPSGCCSSCDADLWDYLTEDELEDGDFLDVS